MTTLLWLITLIPVFFAGYWRGRLVEAREYDKELDQLLSSIRGVVPDEEEQESA